jgi:hypothetical protein
VNRLALTAVDRLRYSAKHTTRMSHNPAQSHSTEAAVLTWKCLPLLVPILLCGCTHNFDRTALRERLNDKKEPDKIGGRIIIEGNNIVSDRVVKSQFDSRPGEVTNGIKSMARRPEFGAYGNFNELKRVMMRGQPGYGITELGRGTGIHNASKNCSDLECEILGNQVRLAIPPEVPGLKRQMWEKLDQPVTAEFVNFNPSRDAATLSCIPQRKACGGPMINITVPEFRDPPKATDTEQSGLLPQLFGHTPVAPFRGPVISEESQK